ncbi:MAG: cupin domain-containing protein [Planctomycetota bacterium]|nr:cupin domain-containing protein [Planctomycetota bacterium]
MPMKPGEPTVCRWNDMPADEPMPLLERRRLIGARAMISHVTLRRGCEVPVHAHENEQMSCVLSGRLRMEFPEAGGAPPRRVVLGPGEAVHIPGGVPHGAVAEDETVVLDVFAPPSATTGIDRRP